MEQSAPQIVKTIFDNFGYGEFEDAQKHIIRDLKSPTAIKSYIEDLESDIKLCSDDQSMEEHVKRMRGIVVQLKRIQVNGWDNESKTH